MPKLDHGFVSFSCEEIMLMDEVGLCVFCDFKGTCQVHNDNLAVKGSWLDEDIRIVVKVCSKQTVLGQKTYNRRGK